MRKSIFDIVSENINIEDAVKRILKIVEEEYILCVDKFLYKKLFKFVDECCFKYWEYRGHFIDVDDYLKALDYTSLKHNVTNNTDSLLTVIDAYYKKKAYYGNVKNFVEFLKSKSI